MSFIEFHDLSHVYHEGQENEHKALQGVDLNIEAGQFTVILGAEWVGKIHAGQASQRAAAANRRILSGWWL
jgi:ABC-type uncharacterized transport system ATPase component